MAVHQGTTHAAGAAVLGRNGAAAAEHWMRAAVPHRVAKSKLCAGAARFLFCPATMTTYMAQSVSDVQPLYVKMAEFNSASPNSQ